MNEVIRLEGKSPETNTYSVHSCLFEVDKRYEIIDVMGAGAYGVVVAAKDTDQEGEEDELLAIKKIERAFEH